MSGRLYRKALKEHERSITEAVNVSAEELQGHIEEDESDFVAPSVNLFELLLNNNDDSDQCDEPNEGGEVSVEKVDESGSVFKSQVAANSATNKKSKRQKKKTKKKNKEQSLQMEFKALRLAVESAHEVNSTKKNNFSKNIKSSILNVDAKHLNAEYELRRKFGSEVVSQFEKVKHAGHTTQGRGVKREGCTNREPLFVTPSEHWPRWDSSLSMEFLESIDGIHYFRYVRSSSYNQAQKEFKSASEYDDLNGVATIVMHHPYHLESLLALADYFRLSGEYQIAADFIAKCLYALQCAWHPMFNPLQGNCKLEYTHETNKPFFASLFNHMRNLDRRGCHRSALEVCKLLLSLDPSDPMGAMFCIDYFSLRAEEYAWLEQFLKEYYTNDFLWNFPNFTYSLAICRFYIQREASSKDGKTTAVGLLSEALMLYPSVLTRLVEKVPLKDKAWIAITNTPVFESEDSGISSLDRLIMIYVEKSYIIWRLPDLHKLLKEVALQVVETLKHDPEEVYSWARLKNVLFPSAGNKYGHLMVSDFSDAAVTIPPEDLRNLLVLDPWADDEEEDEVHDVLRRGNMPRELANRSPLAVLLEPILPWVQFETGVSSNRD